MMFVNTRIHFDAKVRHHADESITPFQWGWYRWHHGNPWCV